MTHLRNLLILICLLLLSVTDGFCAVPEPVAKVVALRGLVTARSDSGSVRTLALKSPVYREDILTTDKRGRAQILFVDNSIISLGGDTVVRIADYHWQPEQEDGDMTTEIKEGVFRVMGGIICNHSPHKVKTKTPTTTIGVRGSMYACLIDQQGVEIIFEGGRGIDLTNGGGTVSITRPGYCSRVRDWNDPPSEPQKTDAGTVAGLLRGLDVGQVADLNDVRSPSRAKISKMAGFSRADQQALYARHLTVRVQEQPGRAAEIFQEEVTSGRLGLEDGLQAAMLGMKNVDRKSFDDLVRRAVNLGLTSDEAAKVAERVKESSGLCR